MGLLYLYLYYYITNQKTLIDKIYLSYISIYRHVSVAYATVTRACHKNTNNSNKSTN